MNLRNFIILLPVLLLPAQGLAAGDMFRGKELYADRCAGCHGVDGKPVMLGAPDFSRGESVLKTYQELAAAVRSGKGVMPGFVGQLKDQDIEDVVAYLKTLY